MAHGICTPCPPPLSPVLNATYTLHSTTKLNVLSLPNIITLNTRCYMYIMYNSIINNVYI